MYSCMERGKGAPRGGDGKEERDEMRKEREGKGS